jgi:aminopeptidase YwaD
MAGRGYVSNGAQKAAEYISAEYTKNGLAKFGADYFQHTVTRQCHTRYRVEITIEDKDLTAGEDFIVAAGCPIIKGVFNVFFVDSLTIDNPDRIESIRKACFLQNIFGC